MTKVQMTTWWLDVIRLMLVGCLHGGRTKIQNLMSNFLILSPACRQANQHQSDVHFIHHEIKAFMCMCVWVLYNMELLRHSSRRTSASYCVHVQPCDSSPVYLIKHVLRLEWRKSSITIVRVCKGVGLWLADFPWYAPDLWLTWPLRG